ncbi:MAG: xanthine dehydrogenase accessory protein XdhC [Shimia sp.]
MARVRVLVAEVRGSAPREAGAEMVVWPGGQSGTIGGGTLEYEAARHALTVQAPEARRHALGPDMGQCCGGAVTLVYEPLPDRALPDPGVPRAVQLADAPRTLAVDRRLAALRGGRANGPCLIDGWLVERRAPPTRPLWIWGAGHVGRALVTTLAPLPDFDITWIDTSPDRFPETIVTTLPDPQPERLMPHAPPHAEHLIVTYSHALDLALCDAALRRGFAFCGLIGSKTKWARFRSRLAALGHAPGDIRRITCPIGDPAIGKHPQAIAISVAHDLVSPRGQEAALGETG